MKDFFAGVVVALCLAVIGFLIYDVYTARKACEAKGGAYINAQCLKIEVIK